MERIYHGCSLEYSRASLNDNQGFHFISEEPCEMLMLQRDSLPFGLFMLLVQLPPSAVQDSVRY